MDWKTTLAEFIEARTFQPFVWGQSDCCMFTYDAILLISGVDIAEWFRGRYKTKTGAYRLLKKYAGGGLAETMDKFAEVYDLTEITLPMAQSGDILLVDTPHGDAAGLYWNGKALVQGENNLMFTPKSYIKKVWRIKKLGE